MPESVYFQVMDDFVIRIGDHEVSSLPVRSHKGISLIEYLMIHKDRPISNQRLFRQFWSGHMGSETVLKTLVSRTRSLLNEIQPGLGVCIGSEPGAYVWRGAEHVSSDIEEIMDLIQKSKEDLPFAQRREVTYRLMELYVGDLFQTGDLNDGVTLCNWLHREYLDAVYAYIRELKERECFNEIRDVCEKAMQVDYLDDTLQMEQMQALVNLNRVEDAERAYESMQKRARRYLDQGVASEMESMYEKLIASSEKIKLNLDFIRNELAKEDQNPPEPFFCDYRTFKEIYNIQIRNLERFGKTVFLGVIMVGDAPDDFEEAQLEAAMQTLEDIMRSCLRKGDIVTRFSQSMYALLLPTVNYQTGNVVMERIEQLFARKEAFLGIPLYHRVSLLGGSPN